MPQLNPKVEYSDQANGTVVADTVRFVSAGTSAPGIYSVHADHLGSPQKMTDANQALVWDAVYTPFGQVHSMTGTATNNQRFPGQYADAKTGFHYNYFHDYDPTTGRYVQSDPIGLGGGLNTFAYAFSNPVKFIDPDGRAVPGLGTVPAPGTPTPYNSDVADAYGDAIDPIFEDPLGETSKEFGNSPIMNCMRGCLLNYWDECKQEYVVGGIGGNAGFWMAHINCAFACSAPTIEPGF